MADVINRIWPEWHTEELLGQGSFGKVYRAIRSGHGHTSYAAIKVIEIPQNPGEAADLASSGMDAASVRSYFEHRARSVLGEVALMEELKGAPNVVGVEDYQLVERNDGVGWTLLVRMPLLQPVKSYFAAVGQPDARETARLGIDICQALAACHAKGVIHRDVKPENIFRGPYGYLLGDFGISRHLEQDVSSAHTRAGAYPYMAPEVFAGKGYGPNVDTYSLGLVLYRYLNNGRGPFLPPEGAFTPADNEKAVALRLAGRQLPAPANADAQLAAVVLRAASPDSSARFCSAAEMGAALEAWLRGTTATAASARQAASPADSGASARADTPISTATVVLDPAQSQAAALTSAAPQPPTPRQNSVTAGWGQAAGGRPTSPVPAAAQAPLGASGTMRVDAPQPEPAAASVGRPVNGEQKRPAKNRTWLVAAAVAAAIVVAIPLSNWLFGFPPLNFGMGASSTSQETDPSTSEPAASEPKTDESTSRGKTEGAPIQPGGYLIDDDVCTIQVTNLSFDDDGDLRIDYTLANHTDKVLDLNATNEDGDDNWTVNGTGVDCTFSPTVEAGETVEDWFRIEAKTLPTSNLDEIYSIAGSLCVRKVDYRYYDASIPDSPAHAKDEFVGSILLDDDVVTAEVTGTYFDSSGKLHVSLFYTNHTDYELDVFDDGLWAVNGVYAEAIFADIIYPGETADDHFFIEPDTLPVTDVAQIESIAGPLKVEMSDTTYYDVQL